MSQFYREPSGAVSKLSETRGSTPQLSSLLEKAERLGLSVPKDLERLAIQRGCRYYSHALEHWSELLADDELRRKAETITNTELAVALLSPQLEPLLFRQRLAAALLGTRGLDPVEVGILARKEEAGDLVHWIATCGHEVEPDEQFWTALVSELSDCQWDPNAIPHPTRFIEMTGITRGQVGIQKRWIRPVTAKPKER